MFVLPQNVLRVFELLKDFEVYLIGGCVRDLLLGITPKDYDFTTQATPSQMQEIFKNQGLRFIEVGREFGTIALVLDSQTFEITTFRKEGVYRDFRKPKSITFASSLLEDTKRRDFTFNAIAYHPKKGLIDYHQGQQDLQAKILKAIGNAKERFCEDALRILRAVGFAMRFDLEIEMHTKQAMFENLKLLDFISKERITSEWEKIINAKFFMKRFLEFEEIFTFIFKEKITLPPSLPRDFLLKNALLLKTPKNLTALRFSNKQNKQIQAFMQWQLQRDFKDKIAIKKMLSLYPKEWIEIFLSQDEQKLQILSTIFQNNEVYHLKDLALSGAELLEFEGKKRGEILQELLTLVIEAKLPNSKEALLSYIKTKNF